MTNHGELWFDAIVGTHVFRVRTVNGVSLRREKHSEKKSNSSLQRRLDESELLRATARHLKGRVCLRGW
jgi:hypothetical protein